MNKYIIQCAFVIFICATGSAHGQPWESYGCIDDCSGHQAGYDWAEDSGIEDESDCNGNSESFNEGCREYVEENQDEEDQE